MYSRICILLALTVPVSSRNPPGILPARSLRSQSHPLPPPFLSPSLLLASSFSRRLPVRPCSRVSPIGTSPGRTDRMLVGARRKRGRTRGPAILVLSFTVFRRMTEVTGESSTESSSSPLPSLSRNTLVLNRLAGDSSNSRQSPRGSPPPFSLSLR